MVDPNTGEFLVPGGLTLSTRLTRKEFLENGLSKQARTLVHNEPYCSYSLHFKDDQGAKWAVGIQFTGERLDSVDLLSAEDRFGTSWEDYTPEKQEAHKVFLDEWLTATLGTPNRTFPWGDVWCGDDQKGGFSLARITYSRHDS